jgi:hypothetical protein
MTEALLELHGHSRRVGLVEWHPTTNNILFSAGYDYKVRWGEGDGPGVGSLARAGSVGDAGGRGRAGDSLSTLTDIGPFGQSVIQSLIHSLPISGAQIFPGSLGGLRHLSCSLWSLVD